MIISPDSVTVSMNPPCPSMISFCSASVSASQAAGFMCMISRNFIVTPRPSAARQGIVAVLSNPPPRILTSMSVTVVTLAGVPLPFAGDHL
jgi:hypothetical protein